MAEYTDGQELTVLWGGERRTVKVVKTFKNGKVRVQLMRGRWVGGKAGSASDPVNVTVEPWQIVPTQTKDPARGH